MTTEGKEVGGFSCHRLTLSAFVLGVFFAQGALAAGDGTAAVGGGLGGASTFEPGNGRNGVVCAVP